MYDAKTKVLPSEFAESSVNGQSVLPQIKTKPKFKVRMILPTPKDAVDDPEHFNYRRLSSIQAADFDVDIENKDIIDVKLPNLHSRRDSNILIDDKS